MAWHLRKRALIAGKNLSVLVRFRLGFVQSVGKTSQMYFQRLKKQRGVRNDNGLSVRSTAFKKVKTNGDLERDHDSWSSKNDKKV